MNKILIISMLLVFCSLQSIAQKVTLFDSKGNARAYIDYDEKETIFLWNGKPVAFLNNDGSDVCVFGFNGNFLGWYEDGIIRDKNGDAIGVRKGAVNMVTSIEPIKGIQEITPIRPITSITPIKPFFSNNWSSKSLTEFLHSGKN